MERIRCVLLDIEGTVCPISFVKETLFPYALRALPHVLATQWDSPSLAPYLAAFPPDVRDGPEKLQAHVEDLTRRDVKVAALKNLQGYLWEDGYVSGAYATTLFPDVEPALRAWQDEGKALVIYSSGSVFAQKLLFGHVQVTGDGEEGGAEGKKRGFEEVTAVEEVSGAKAQKTEGGKPEDGEDAAKAKGSAAGEGGEIKGKGPRATEAGSQDHPSTSEHRQTVNSSKDLTDMFVGWFDTTNAGLKTESSSYSKIADALKYAPEEILFLSDNVKEVDAAVAAGMTSIVVDRPGNAPLSDADKGRLQIVESISKIDSL